MQKLSHQTHSFGEFTLDLTRGCLLRGQEEIKLRPKSFEALKYLVENNGRLISKDELIHAVWVDTAVTDDSLVKCMKDIRHALGDEAQQIIKTVPRRGYIFDKEVTDNGSTAQVSTYTEETAGVQRACDCRSTRAIEIWLSFRRDETAPLERTPWRLNVGSGGGSHHLFHQTRRGNRFSRSHAVCQRER